MKLVIGLVGGIGSGKSTVAAAFAGHGARVIAGDALGHEALRQPDLKARVVERWGPGVLDERGEVNRGKVAALVFADPEERRVLESWSFPYIRRRLREEIARAQADPGVALVVVDAAVLLEAGWNDLCDRIVYVHAPEEVRTQRLRERRGWSAQEVEARERAQWPLADKARRADATLDNVGPPEEVARRVGQLVARWTSPGS